MQLRRLLEHLFRTRDEIPGRGEARRTARRLLNRWRQILTPAPVDRAIDELDKFDWIVFSSVNGVLFFLNRLLKTGHDLRHLGRAKLAVVGPGTADELGRYYLKADLQPDQFQADALAAALAPDASGKRFLLIRASRGREVLAETSGINDRKSHLPRRHCRQ